MPLQQPDWRAPRTLVIGVGALGRDIVEAAARRYASRTGLAPTVTFVAIVLQTGTATPGDDGSGGAPARAEILPPETAGVTPSGEIQNLVLPVDVDGKVTRRAARCAALAAGGDIIRCLVGALGSLSRIDETHSFQPAPLRTKAIDELAIYLVVALDDPLAGSWALDLAFLCRQLARQRLNQSAAITGLLLLPDLLHDDSPQPALAHTYAALCELESTLKPHDGWPARWGEHTQVDGWGPAFDRGCYLLGPLNGQGQGLGRAGERTELAAEALVQLALAPLGSRCESPLLPAWSTGQRSQAFGSLGVAAWVYPAEALIDHGARRIGQTLCEAWLADPTPADLARSTSAGTAFLETSGLAMSEFGLALVPEAAGLLSPLRVSLSLRSARSARASLDQALRQRIEALEAVRSAMEPASAAMAAALLGQATDHLGTQLDGPTGSLRLAAAFVDAASVRLAEARAGCAAAAAALADESQRVDDEMARVGEHLDAISLRVPDASWRAMMNTGVRPARLWQAIQAFQDLSNLAPAYAALVQRRVSLAIQLVQQDGTARTWDAVARGIEQQRLRVDCLRASAEAARALIARPLPAPFGALGFALEHSVLTPQTVDDLVGSVLGSVEETLQRFAGTPDRLSGWPAAGADGEDLAGVCLDFARRRCQELRGVPLEPLLVRTLGQSPRQRAEALQALAESASPFLGWDEAKLRSDEHQVLHECVVLGLPQGATTSAGSGVASPLLEGLDEILWAQVVSGGDPCRVTVLSTIQGLPLAALAGLEEFEAAYDREDPAALHVLEGWLPSREPSEHATVAGPIDLDPEEARP